MASGSSVIRLADTYGPVLTGRHLATGIRTEVEELLRHEDHVTIDLRGVEAMSPSFADEILGKLQVSGGDRVRFKNAGPQLRTVARMVRSSRIRDL